MEGEEYANRTGFAIARLAIGGRVAWLGWTAGVALTIFGLLTSLLFLVCGAALLVAMLIGAILRMRDRRDSERIARRPPMSLPHETGAELPPVHLHIAVPDQHEEPTPD